MDPGESQVKPGWHRLCADLGAGIAGRAHNHSPRQKLRLRISFMISFSETAVKPWPMPNSTA